MQIHGGYGVSKEFPLERWYREARVRRIGEGPSEVTVDRTDPKAAAHERNGRS